MLLAGDIGGTKTNLAVFSREKGPRTALAEATFASGRFPSLEAMVSQFLTQVELEIDRASFGVAGPVVDGRATITNLPWVMNEEGLQVALRLPDQSVRLLNDLDAVAHAVPWLGLDDLFTLNQGQAAPRGAIAVIAPGTGLGEAFLTWDGIRYRAHASEGGHADFAPSKPLESGLLHYLQGHLDHVSYERVCSGSGLPNIYHYLRDRSYAEEPSWLAERLAAAEDPTPVIVNAALDPESDCKLCKQTLELFVSALGAEAGNLALKVLATGGVYLGGGIPPRILSALKDGPFMHSFQNKGRLSDLLAQMPVHVIRHPQVALLGAACHGLEVNGSVASHSDA